MTEQSPDAIVIGSGPNGLCAACVLAKAGLRTLVLEAHPKRPGGAVGSQETTLPGFIHDVGAAFFPFGTLSPAFRTLDLAGQGLRFRHAEIESAHPAADGSLAILSRNSDLMQNQFGSARDGATWRRLTEQYAGMESSLLGAILSPLMSMEQFAATMRLLPLDALRLLPVFLASGRGFSMRTFESGAARRVLPGLALHTDVGPDDAFGCGLGYMLAVMATTGGFSVAEGGSRAITDALVKVLEAGGGRLRLGARVQRVIVADGRARAVVLQGGEEIEAREAILANTAAPNLFLDLIERKHLPGHVVRRMRRFAQGWGTFKVDWALSGPAPWTLEPCRRSAVVHAGDSLDDLSRFTRQVRAGQLPERPYLVIGQQSLCDPSRAPEGRHTLWAYSHVPSRVSGGWENAKEGFADTIDQRIEELAPGFRSQILARQSVSPDDLEAMDANLRGGDLGGGSNSWNHQMIFRPLFPYFRYRTPVRRLYLASSYAHPGAGVHGMCGFNAARVALRDLA